MERNNNFAFFHWLGIILVILGHQYVLMGAFAPKIFGIDCHSAGVKIMFVVSGYLVTESMKHTPSTKKFILKRVIRIYPGLIINILGLALIAGLFLTSLPIGRHLVGCKAFIFQNILMYPSFALPETLVNNPYPFAINGSLWTLPIEFMCCLLLPFVRIIYKAIKKSRINANIVPFLIIIPTYVAGVLVELGTVTTPYVVWGTDWFYALSIITYFCLGSISSLYREKIKFDLQISILLLFIYMATPGILNVIIRPIAIAYFVLALALTTPPALKNIFEKYKWYYTSYLWAFPIQQILIQILMVREKLVISPFVMFLISSIITLSFSCFIYKFIENPIGKLLGKFNY